MAQTKNQRSWTERMRITVLVLVISVGLIITGFLLVPFNEVLAGEWKIITSPGILITDFIALTNIGSALFNAGIVSLMGLGLAWLINARFNGYLLSAIFTLMGFAFFGKTPFNIIPIFIGVYVYDTFFSPLAMRDLIAPLLFGTTLGPVVSQIAFGFGWGWGGVVAGILVGILCGLLMASVMGHVYTFHLGYNLYNTGTSAGFIGTVVYMMMRGFGLEIKPAFYWSTESTVVLSIILIVVLFILILLGLIWGGNRKSYKTILETSGKLASDYVEITDLGTTLVNMGVIGAIGLGYVLIVGGDHSIWRARKTSAEYHSNHGWCLFDVYSKSHVAYRSRSAAGCVILYDTRPI